MLPEEWHNRELCIECFLEVMDAALIGNLELQVSDFHFVALVGDKIGCTLIDRT
jgi:hypothetical protein